MSLMTTATELVEQAAKEAQDGGKRESVLAGALPGGSVRSPAPYGYKEDGSPRRRPAPSAEVLAKSAATRRAKKAAAKPAKKAAKVAAKREASVSSADAVSLSRGDAIVAESLAHARAERAKWDAVVTALEALA